MNNARQTGNDAWELPAEWVDYAGPVDSETVGIAIFSHPKKFSFPTALACAKLGIVHGQSFRTIGLSPPRVGSTGCDDDQKRRLATLQYRALFHGGNAEEADVASAFHDFAEE